MARAGNDNFEAADRLVLAAIKLVRTLKALTPPEALTSPQISALGVVLCSGRITARELARHENVRPPSISVVVAQLEARGLVARTADPADARKQWIKATKAGRKLFERGHRRRLAPLASALAGLAKDERQRLADSTTALEALSEAIAKGLPEDGV